MENSIQRNAKICAFFETIPELLHNSVESYRTWPTAGQPLTALLLRPNNGRNELAAHFGFVSQLLERNAIPHCVVEGVGYVPLAQLLDMVVLGDYVSYYLALLGPVDPSPTPTLEEAKELLGNLVVPEL